MYLNPPFAIMSKEALKMYSQPAGAVTTWLGPAVFVIDTLAMLIVHCAFAVYILAKAQIVIKESKVFFMLHGFVGRFMDPFLNK